MSAVAKIFNFSILSAQIPDRLYLRQRYIITELHLMNGTYEPTEMVDNNNIYLLKIIRKVSRVHYEEL